MQVNKILVVGAGPAGMMAAIRAAQLKQDVTLLEKNSILGKKLLLSGKGRCNLTNACDLDSFLKRFSHNGQFLRDAFKKFFNADLMKFFEERGLRLKTERQLRVFPLTDRSTSVADVLRTELQRTGVKILFKTSVSNIITGNGAVKGVGLSDKRIIECQKLILATGGASYKFTGSTGEGIDIAKRLGHKIVVIRPGLVGLKTKETFVKSLEGLVLKNIRLKFSDEKKKLLSEVGELMFTDTGISGPLVITLSGAVIDWLAQSGKIICEIDLKPGLTKEQLEARLLREFSGNPKKTIKSTLRQLLPQSLIKIFLEKADLSPEKIVSQITQAERARLVNLLKAFTLDIIGSRPLEDAMISRGGVSLKDINPRTMESSIIKGLYFCGEMIDVDADTGGFNLQAAFSTGYLAGESASS